MVPCKYCKCFSTTTLNKMQTPAHVFGKVEKTKFLKRWVINSKTENLFISRQ